MVVDTSDVHALIFKIKSEVNKMIAISKLQLKVKGKDYCCQASFYCSNLFKEAGNILALISVYKAKDEGCVVWFDGTSALHSFPAIWVRIMLQNNIYCRHITICSPLSQQVHTGELMFDQNTNTSVSCWFQNMCLGFVYYIF